MLVRTWSGDLSAEEGELKSEAAAGFRLEVPGEIPPFGAVPGVWTVICGEFEVAWAGDCVETVVVNGL